MTSTEWDREYAGMAHADLLPRLAREAFGPDYPFQLRPYGFTTWTLLRDIRDRLDLRPGQRLLDLACGEAGCGLWLAGQSGARLTGVDFSALARERAREFATELSMMDGELGARISRVHSEFVAGTFTATGLEDSSMDAAICLDALMYCDDRPGTFAEVFRVLRPGGRFACTAQVAANAPVDYLALAQDAGLVVEHHGMVDGWRDGVRRNFQLWREHERELRALFGNRAAALLLDEASTTLAQLDDRRQSYLVAGKPG